MRTSVTVTYLELRPNDPQRLKPDLPDGYALRLLPTPQPEVNRYLYATVGEAWGWVDRLPWTLAQWEANVRRDGFETWLLQEADAIAGYFELEPATRGEGLNLAYFGLMPGHLGKGLGGALLSRAILRAWARGASRLTVNTCTLDHPGALANYQARGFQNIREVTYEKEMPDP